MKTTSSLIKLVVFAVATIAAFGMLALTISPIAGGDRTQYKAVLADATGLAKGDDVRIAGVPVGRVKDIGLSGRSRALVVAASSAASMSVCNAAKEPAPTSSQRSPPSRDTDSFRAETAPSFSWQPPRAKRGRRQHAQPMKAWCFRGKTAMGRGAGWCIETGRLRVSIFPTIIDGAKAVLTAR